MLAITVVSFRWQMFPISSGRIFLDQFLVDETISLPATGDQPGPNIQLTMPTLMSRARAMAERFANLA
jgi:hypothetical protein